VHGGQTISTLLNAGLLDEIHIDLAAVLLGSGVSLFDELENTPVMLGDPTVVAGWPRTRPATSTSIRRSCSSRFAFRGGSSASGT
jgi:dihydrofolate reductase